MAVLKKIKGRVLEEVKVDIFNGRKLMRKLDDYVVKRRDLNLKGFQSCFLRMGKIEKYCKRWIWEK